jgi:hypothetical protein
VFCTFDKARTQGIRLNITTDVEKVSFGHDAGILKTTLIDMARTRGPVTTLQIAFIATCMYAETSKPRTGHSTRCQWFGMRQKASSLITVRSAASVNAARNPR